MKLTTNRNVNNQLGDVESHKVKIKASGKAFATLVRGIYEDKVAAFVREIATNALDAHIQAGTPELPFRVDMPDGFDPYYRVRDYGVSMDHDTVVNIFGTLFESTKDDSNEVVGAFGLGSKSPLAYADSFEVTAWLDGERRVYLVSIDNEGTPTITVLSREASDDPQGLEVAVPIRDGDYSAVADAAKNILPGFDVMPKVVGTDIPAPNVVFEGDGYRLVKTDRQWGSTKILVRMGCVLYPVDERSIGGYGLGLHSFDGSIDLVIDVPMGSVGITTSREALELTEDTKAMLEGRVKGIITEVGEAVNAKFDACSNRLEATKLLLTDGVAGFWSPTPTFDDAPLNGWLFLDGGSKKNGAGASGELPYVRQGTSRSANPMTQYRYDDVSDTRFVYGDTKAVKRATVRYRNFIEETSGPVYWLNNPTREVMERMVRLLGAGPDNFVWVGSLPDPGPVKRGTKAKVTGKPQGVYSATETRYGKPVELDEMPDDYYWFEGSRVSAYELRGPQDLLETLIANGGDDLPMVVMTATAKKRYKPSEDRQIGKALADQLADQRDEILEAATEVKIHRSIFGEADRTVAENLAPITSDQTAKAELFDYVTDWGQRGELQEKVNEAVDQLKDCYPMLFSPTPEMVRDYIESVNAEKLGD